MGRFFASCKQTAPAPDSTPAESNEAPPAPRGPDGEQDRQEDKEHLAVKLGVMLKCTMTYCHVFPLKSLHLLSHDVLQDLKVQDLSQLQSILCKIYTNETNSYTIS